jgi:uncharacterized membrane-anchored protein
MTEIIVAMIGFFAMTSVALIEKVRRDNKRDHGIVAMKLDMIAQGLGRSIDEVRDFAQRTEANLDEHVGDHARGSFK